MDVKTTITLKFIVKHSTSLVDLKWKLNKFLESGDVSFLGNLVKELKEEIKKLEDEDKQISHT